MAQNFKEVAHLRTDTAKFSEGWDRIFGNKKDHDEEVKEQNIEAAKSVPEITKIKELARQAYRDQQSQDNEGGVPCSISFIAGFVEGYKAEKNK